MLNARDMTAIRVMCSLVVTVALAGSVEAAETWTYAASEHFEVYTTGNAAKAREAMNYVEQVPRDKWTEQDVVRELRASDEYRYRPDARPDR